MMSPEERVRILREAKPNSWIALSACLLMSLMWWAGAQQNQYIEHLDTREKQLDTALVNLKRRISRLTPAECTWQAIVWRPKTSK